MFLHLSPIRSCTCKIAAIGLLITLSVNSLLAAPESAVAIYNAVGNLGQDVAHTLPSSGYTMANFLSIDMVRSWWAKLSKKTTLDKIVIQPADESGGLSIMQGQTVVFTAIGYAGEDTIGGTLFRWTVQDEAKEKQARSLQAGVFNATRSGRYLITAAAENGQQSQITVAVTFNEGYPIRRLLEKKESERTEPEMKGIDEMRKKGHLISRTTSSKGYHDPAVERALYEADKQKREDIETQQRLRRQKDPEPPQSSQNTESYPETSGDVPKLLSRGGPTVNDADPEPIKSQPKKRMMMRPADNDGWDGSNWYTADDPGNAIGHPENEAPDAGAGNGDFQFSAPLVSLSGRGMDVNLSLFYNSRLWSKSGTAMTYDADKGWPAPGWNLGFGKMIYMGSSGGCMLVTPDGTRRSYTTSVMTYGSSGSSYYMVYATNKTSDGSFIDYSCVSESMTYSPYHTLSGTATLPNGTVIQYSSPDSSYGQMYPTRITDAQGNYIDIAYKSDQGPEINFIKDTLGRVITFNYDTSTPTKLISISGPGINSSTATYVRFHYTSLSIGTGLFDNTYSVDTATSSPTAIDAIFYPATSTGYWFGTTGSYSPYGMISKIIQQRGMTYNSGTGAISSGSVSDQRDYDYPTAGINTLTDAPLYTMMTETWAGIDTANAVTHYSVTTTGSDEVITVEQPDGSLSKQTSVASDGVYYLGETYASSSASTPLSKTKMYFEAGDYGSTRVNRVEKTDELSHTTATDLLYAASKYNQIITLKEYEYGGTTLYRQTNNTYTNYSGYINRHIFNLLKTTEVIDSASTRLKRTDYQYDNNAEVNGTGSPGLMELPNDEEEDAVVMHTDTSDPYTDHTHLEQGGCLPFHWNYTGCYYDGQEMYIDDEPFGYWDVCSCSEYAENNVSNYDPYSVFRGNVTKTTFYTNASTQPNPSGPIAYDYTYDVAGNQRTATTNCCQQVSSTYSFSTQYSQPDSMTKGSSSTASSLRMTESATYDTSNLIMLTSTDFNGITTTYNSYDSALRPTLVTLHSGATTVFSYDDANMGTTSTSKLSDGTTIVGESTIQTNGRGQTTLSRYLAGSTNWNAQSIQYDVMGRKWKESLPYDSGSSPSNWIEFSYDRLSRITQMAAPDGSTSKNFYNESTRPSSASSSVGQTIRTQDAWGRERWARTDDFGRLVEVVEPDPDPTRNGAVFGTGSGTNNVATTYSYDQLDQLMTITQGSQIRSFKYDSLGRLTLQKIAEQTATINDSGNYVTPDIYGVRTGANWSEAFEYDERSNVKKRTDARGVITTFEYKISGSPDPLNRLQSISYDATGAPTTPAISSAPSVSLEYMTTGDQTRVKKTTTSGIVTEENSFDTEGRISQYEMKFNSRTGYAFDTNYSYDTANRITEIKYPKRYGITLNIGGTNVTDPQESVTPFYDQTSRLTQMKVDGSTYLSDISYNTASQVTQLKTGAATSYPRTETYSYDSQTGLPTGQTVQLTGTRIYMDVSYSYSRGSSAGSQSGKTGQMTKIIDNLDHNRDKTYEFDGLGRLSKAKGGIAAGASSVTANWMEEYSYDRYGNKTGVSASGVTQDSNSVPADGLASVGVSTSTNQITDSGWEYDLTGNLIRGQDASGSWQRFEYDAAGRLKKVKDDSNNILETYTYGATRARLITETSSQRTYYAWGGQKVVAEYTEASTSTTPAYSKAYIYAGSRLLLTMQKTSGTTESKWSHHPNRLGTALITYGIHSSFYEQSTLPFGTPLLAESTGYSNQAFTSYDRSSSSGLDYAVNRTYSKGQSRFTQVDPLKMGAAYLSNPQSHNLYTYAQNMPTDFVDPLGLYTGCAHQAMTKFLANLAGLGPTVADALGGFAGEGLEGADSTKHAATGFANWVYGLFNTDGDAHDIHFPAAATLERERGKFQSYLNDRNYQAAGFVLHAIEDYFGAHQGYSLPEGHLADTLFGIDPDKVLGDSKFRNAANEAFKTLSNNPSAALTSDQMSDLIDAILKACGKDFRVDKLRPRRAPPGTVPRGLYGGGGLGGGDDSYYGFNNHWGGLSELDLLWIWYNNQHPPQLIP